MADKKPTPVYDAYNLTKEQVVTTLVCVRERRDRLIGVLASHPTVGDEVYRSLKEHVDRCNTVIYSLGSTP